MNYRQKTREMPIIFGRQTVENMKRSKAGRVIMSNNKRMYYAAFFFTSIYL